MLFPQDSERYKGLTIAGDLAYPDHTVDIPAEAVHWTFILNLGLHAPSGFRKPREIGPGHTECRFCDITPADYPMRAVEAPWVNDKPTPYNEELRPMEPLTLTLHKAKDTKNKVVYGTKDGSVIQSVYIDKDALGDVPPAAIQVVISSQ